MIDSCGIPLEGLTPPMCIEKPLNTIPAQVLLFLLENYIIVALLGYTLIKPFFSSFSLGNLLASFFVGYTSLLGIIRIYSLFLPYKNIFWPVFFTELLIILLYKNQNSYSQILTAFKRNFNSKNIIKNILGAILILIFLFSVLALHIRQANFAWVGHGHNQYAWLLENWQETTPTHFPYIDKHYDELIFHYFLTSPFKITFDPTIPWWFTLGLIKTSLLAFLFFVFKKMGSTKWQSLIFTLFLFLGTSSLIPTKYYMLFDSSNFLYFTVHSGRMVGFGITLLLLVNMFSNPTTKKLGLFPLFIIALGLSATSISNAFWLWVIYTWIMITKICFDNDSYPKPANLTLGTVICYSSILMIFTLYGLPFKEDFFYTVRALGVSFLILLLINHGFPKIIDLFYKEVALFKTQKNTIIQYIILVGGISFGLIFCGNLFVNNPLRKISTELIGKYTTPAPIYSFGSLQSYTFNIGDHREIGRFNEHCQGAFQFAAYYGWILIMILLVNHLFIKKIKLNIQLSWKDFALYDTFLMLVVSLLFFLFLMDFVDFGSHAWLKSRFLEGPVFGIIVIFFYLIHKAYSTKQKIVALLILLLYTITPFVATERPRQIKSNGEIFFNELKSGR